MAFRVPSAPLPEQLLALLLRAGTRARAPAAPRAGEARTGGRRTGIVCGRGNLSTEDDAALLLPLMDSLLLPRDGNSSSSSSSGSKAGRHLCVPSAASGPGAWSQRANCRRPRHAASCPTVAGAPSATQGCLLVLPLSSHRASEKRPSPRQRHRPLSSQVRLLSTDSFSPRRRLRQLEVEADSNPSNARAQAELYKELLRAGNAAKVIMRVENSAAARDQACLQYYAIALAKTNQASRIVPCVLEFAERQFQQQQTRGPPPDPHVQNRTYTETPLPPSQPPIKQSESWFSQWDSSKPQDTPAQQKTPTPISLPGDKNSPIHVVLDESRYSKWGAAKWVAMSTVWGFFLITFVSLGLENTGLLRATPTQSEFEPSVGNVVKFSDVKGVDEAKSELEEIVEFLKDPSKFSACGGKLPKGVLLTGPPGTGKTLLARAVAGEAGVPFFFMSGSEFDEVYVGVGAKRVRELFAAARRKAPSIVFIDELDAIGGKRSAKDQSYMRQTLNQLLVDLDGFSQSEGVIFIGATNFPELLDKALLRPGRFDRHVGVPLPDVRGRVEILKHHMRDVHVADDVDVSRIARGTPGFSGADLANLVNLAAIQASRDGHTVVTMKHMDHAKDRILMGAELRSKFITEENKKLTAYHEGGHALVAFYTPGAMPLHKATIMPRGKALGMVVQLPEMDKENFTRMEYLAQLDIAMGGRVAEELIFGKENVTSGAMSDIANATGVARRMVTLYGMSDKVGPVYHDDDDIISAGMKATIEAEIKSLLEGAKGRATKLLTDHIAELHRLARALIEFETLAHEEIESIIQGRTIAR